MNPVTVVSLFDGMSCGQLAPLKLGIPIQAYYASEIDKHALQVTQHNFPNTIQLGDVEGWKEWDIDWSEVDLILAGSPCQGFSLSGKGAGFKDRRSRLLYVFVDILNHTKSVNPNVKFLLENVHMKKEWIDKIGDFVGVDHVVINSNLVSAQNRLRYYWANFTITQPKDRGLVMLDILNKGSWIRDDSIVPITQHSSRVGLKCIGAIDRNRRWGNDGKTLQRNFSQGERIYSVSGKCPTLSANMGGTAGSGNVLISNDISRLLYRRLSAVECERLQTVPDGYTSSSSDLQRHKMLGNGWTVDVIVHILRCLYG